jgi:selenocysteine lyase/cysteine desulfurase
MKGAAATGLLALLKPSTATAHGWVPEEFRHGPLPTKLMPYPLIKGNPSQERFWHEVRRAFPLPPVGHYCHYNTGTTGSQPFFSINNLAVYNLYKSRDPVFWQNNLANDFPDLFEVPTGGSHQSAIYAELADMFNGNTDEFVLSYNTSDGMLNCTTGIKWNAGDRIVTTNMEHPCGEGSVAWPRDMYGVSVSVVDIPFDGGFNLSVDQFVELFRPALSAPLAAGAKQVLVFSQISYKNGFVMPAKELTALAHSFGNTWVLIDSAHGWGQLVMDCKDIGADFIAGAGHKWLCGGPGTGILYVRNSSGSYPRIPFNPWTEGWGNIFTVPSARFNTETRPGARGNNTLNTGMQSRGEWNRCASFAMADTARWYHYIGLQNIYKRGTDMAAYFQKKVIDRWGLKALWINPAVDQRFKGFVTAFNPFKGNTDPANFAAQTAAIGKVVSNLQASIDKDLNPTGKTPIYLASRSWPNRYADGKSTRAALRVSTHAMYSSREETDFVIEQIAKEVDASGLPQLP